jgi:hypothetical protein
MSRRFMTRKRVGWLVLAGALIWSCNPTTGCGCTPTAAVATVHGTVQLASGGPAVSATVSGYIAQADGCVARNFPDGLVQTGSDGSYTLGIPSGSETDTVCVLVRVRPPSGSGLSAMFDTTIHMAIRYTPPFDSAEVNAVLGGPLTAELLLNWVASKTSGSARTE